MFHFVSPSSSSHAVFIVFWIASHGRVLAAGLHPNSLHVRHMRLKVLFSRGFTVRSPGSWLGGSWVSALPICVKTRERRGSSFSQLGLEPNHTGLTAQSLFFLEESCRVKRSDTQTFSNFSNYFKRVLKLQKRSSSFSK